MKTRIKVGLVVGAVVLLGSAGAWIARRNGQRGVEVEVGKVVRKEIVATVLANGKVQPLRKVDISANIAGQVVNLAVREGERVAKGDFLLQIDRVQYQASTRSSEANLQSLLHDRDAAQANLEQARYDLDKARKSFDEQLIPEAELQRARSSFEAAAASSQRGRAARRAGARRSRGRARHAEQDDDPSPDRRQHHGAADPRGRGGGHRHDEQPGHRALDDRRPREMEADLAVDETDMPRLAVGQKATLTIDAYPERTFEGVVREVGVEPDPSGLGRGDADRQHDDRGDRLRGEGDAARPARDMRPGFSVTAEIESGRAKDVPVIPIQALVSRDPEPSPSPPAATPSAAREVEEGVYLLRRREGRASPASRPV